MNIILYGANGKMGKMVAQCVQSGFGDSTIVAKVSPSFSTDPASHTYSTIDEVTESADCVIDFSNHTCTQPLTSYCVKRKIPLIIATTGQTTEETTLIESAAQEIPVFLASNMSIGVAVLCSLAKQAAAAFPGADIEIVEAHHNQKLDVPSGTAKTIANSIAEVRDDANFIIGRHENGKRTKEEIGIHSLRIGSVVGMHEVIISTGYETITLKHEAENRALFAEGAISAAAFLIKQSAGLYNMKDIVK